MELKRALRLFWRCFAGVGADWFFARPPSPFVDGSSRFARDAFLFERCRHIQQDFAIPFGRILRKARATPARLTTVLFSALCARRFLGGFFTARERLRRED